MVESIQGFGSPLTFGSFPTSPTLTDDEVSKVKSILSQYDSSNLTKDNAKAIFRSFREAGITPGQGLADAIDAAGFDAKSLFLMVRPKRHHPPAESAPVPTDSVKAGDNQTIDVSKLKDLQSLLNNYDLSNLSSDDKTSLLSKLSQRGFLQQGNLFDLGA
jgi:hypothetical protein